MPEKYHEFRNFAAKCHGLRKNIYDFFKDLTCHQTKMHRQARSHGGKRNHQDVISI